MSNKKTIFTKAFKDRLITLLQLLNNTFPNINSGGCAHFAKLLYPKLKKLTDDIQVVYIQQYGSTDQLKVLKEYYSDYVKSSDVKDLDEIGISHVMIICEGKYIDSSGIFKSVNEFKKINSLKMYAEIGTIQYDELGYWLNNKEWNDEFDTKNVKKMKDIIDANFNKELSIMERLQIYTSN